MKNLRIGSNLNLPADAQTQTFGILAKRGVGKTYTALVMAEEMIKAGLRIVIADPIGVTWGLRASADGKGAGLPIGVLGGEHGDLPLEVTAGELVADLVVDEGVSLVLDLSRFRKGEQTRFMTSFSERLYHKNREPLHLFLDEADAFAPQRPAPGEQRMLGAVEDLVRRGRARGIGVTLITQRAAVLNKNVLTQLEVLIALRTIAPQDRAAIEAWIEVHGTEEQKEELLGSIASLAIGEAWFWSPGWLDMFKLVHVRQRETFDSSATPKAGAKAREPKRLADVDLAALQRRMAATVERAKAADPKALRARVAELERELAKKPAAEPVRVQVPILKEAQAKRLEATSERVLKLGEQLVGVGREIAGALRNGHAKPPPAPPSPPPPLLVAPAALERIRTSRPSTGATDGMGAERRVLAVLASRAPARLTRAQLGTLAGLAWKAGTFNTYMSRLRTAGYVEEDGGLVAPTDQGMEAIGEQVPAPKSPEQVQAMWRAALGENAAGRLVAALVEAYPETLSRARLAELTGLTANAGTFGTYLSRVRSNGLIEEAGGEIRAAPILMGEV